MEEKHRANIEKVADEVVDKVGNPLSELAVAALIESMGYRNIDCPVEFGKSDIFELSGDVYKIAKRKARLRKKKESLIEKGARSVFKVLKYYITGVSLGLPIITQVGFIVLTGYSLWAWVGFSELQATLVAFATIWSFLVSGGFTQVMGREVTYYLTNGNRVTAKKIAFELLKYGTAVSATSGILFFVLNLTFGFFDVAVVPVILTYYILLSELWLVSGVVYAMKKRFPVVFGMTVGTLVVYWLHKFKGESIYVAHFSGLIVANLIIYIWAHAVTKLTPEDLKKAYVSVKAKRTSVLIYANSPFFKFGLLYFLLLFLDRVVSWTASSGVHPYFFWFKTPYELGMDWALLSFGITLGFLDYLNHNFSELLIPVQKRHPAVRIKRYGGWFIRFYYLRLVLLYAVGVASIVGVYVGVMQFKSLEHIREVREFFASPITFKTYYFASVSYLFLAHALFNNLLFFTLWKPNYGLTSIKIAIVVDLMVGVVASRVFGWEYGVVGFFAGSAVYAIVSSYHAVRFLRDLDYNYYSAF